MIHGTRSSLAAHDHSEDDQDQRNHYDGKVHEHLAAAEPRPRHPITPAAVHTGNAPASRGGR